MNRTLLEERIRGNPSGLCLNHIDDLVGILQEEGWGNKIYILATIRDYMDEILNGDNAPINLRKGQSIGEVIRHVRDLLHRKLEPGGENLADNTSEPESGRKKL